VIDNNKHTGAETMHFEYKEQMQKIFEDDPVFNPVYDIESREGMNLAKEQREKEEKERRSSVQQTAEFYD